jgi:hypothetical protein
MRDDLKAELVLDAFGTALRGWNSERLAGPRLLR